MTKLDPGDAGIDLTKLICNDERELKTWNW